MKSLLIFILLSILSVFPLYSQSIDATKKATSILSEQESAFVEHFIEEYNKNINRFECKVERNISYIDKYRLPSDYSVLYIPTLFVRSKKPDVVRSEDFLMYINKYKLCFTYALLFSSDKSFVGLSPYNDCGQYLYNLYAYFDKCVYKNTNLALNFTEGFLKEFPDYVFMIDGIGSHFFLIKDKRLYVLFEMWWLNGEFIPNSNLCYLPINEFIERIYEFIPNQLFPFDSYFGQKKYLR